MSVKSLRTKASNRAATAQARINSTASPYEKLRHALEWVMSEARAAGRDTAQDTVATITKVARELNERSRP
ncbi:hypothetical protein [Micromonospora carbonacea]|uniref:Uncharacterized protein n=1 Tax=Micromonospora carbonacea TaxID=47853 RepID=A0A1C5AB84_9ACTN|nr:hypothetical protein [Micromonospora carbonacea]SCF42465.1 hypothetical protein GA0070563_11282 [Micromonospora carbonacea]